MHSNITIILPITGIQPPYLHLKKQHFVCKACERSITASRKPIVKKNCFISVNTIAQVVIKSTEAQPLLSICRDCSVSPTTVQRVIIELAKKYKPHHQVLPKHLSFDEFKYAKGKFPFNVVIGDILDILEESRSRAIKGHFITNYCLKDRKQAETVTIDMNAGYATVFKEMFPQAEIFSIAFTWCNLLIEP